MLLTASQLLEFTKVRDALMAAYYATDQAVSSWLDPRLIDRFVEENPAGLSAVELDRARQWRTAAEGPFFVMRHTGSCTIFMNHLGTFAVRGTEHELSRLVPKTPTQVEATLVAFDGLIVCAEDPCYDSDVAGEADHARIDATYRGLTDKGVIYSANVMMRMLREQRSAVKPAPDAVVAVESKAEGKEVRLDPMRGTVAPRMARVDSAAEDEPSDELSYDADRGEGHHPELSGEALAPVEMLETRDRHRYRSAVPSGLAQIIAFKPRTSAQAALS